MKTLVKVKRLWILIGVMALLSAMGYAGTSQTDSTADEDGKATRL